MWLNLFICCLFNDAVRDPVYKASSGRKMNNKLERIWKESILD
jgi:hypothetical protein